MNNQKATILLLVSAFMFSILALDQSINAQSQIYDFDYGNDHYKNYPDSKKGSDINRQEISCVDSNINVNGIDVTQIPNDDTALEATNEGVDDANKHNVNSLADTINFDRNLVNICVNVNVNDQTKVEPPETATLTVKKAIFGCDNIDGSLMTCDTLQNDSPSWIPCTDPAISGTINCQSLPANLFDIQVLDDQNTQIQQFDGSLQGTTIQNLPSGTYTVNEIKHQGSAANQLEESALAEQACISDGFSDGGILFNTTAGVFYDPICFEYEDEQGNDCSTLTLQPGENKTCIVKNYMQRSDLD